MSEYTDFVWSLAVHSIPAEFTLGDLLLGAETGMFDPQYHRVARRFLTLRERTRREILRRNLVQFVLDGKLRRYGKTLAARWSLID